MQMTQNIKHYLVLQLHLLVLEGYRSLGDPVSSSKKQIAISSRSVGKGNILGYKTGRQLQYTKQINMYWTI